MSFSRRDFMKIGGLSIAACGLVNKVLADAQPDILPQLKNMATDVKPLTPRDYLARNEKARRLMFEQKIDGLFLTGSTNMQYFFNVNWGRSERTFGVVMSTRKAPVWICPDFEAERAEERIPQGQEIRTWHEHESPYKLIAGILDEVNGSRLALGPTVRHFVAEGLKKDAPTLEVVGGEVITGGCRAVKTEKELGYMDLANRITKMAYREGFKSLREDMSTGDLSGAISSAHRKMGVSGSGGPQFGPNSAFPHGSSVQRTLQDGYVVLVDGGCGIEGFRSDVTRTVVFGKATDKQKRVWDIVRQSQLAAHNAVRPGVACEDVDRAARKVVEDAGFGPEYKYFGHRVGHGIGMEGHEYPYLVRGNKLKLQPGMTFSNEPGIYIYGEFGVRIEDCFVVTEDGARFLGGLESTAIDKPFG
ncbi:M24 family metallopeptidase [Planctomycetota bacterium]